VSAPVELRPFEVDRDAPFERFEARDRAPGWVVFVVAFGLFVVAVALLVIILAALRTSDITVPIDRGAARIAAIGLVAVILAILVPIQRRRGRRIQELLRREGLPHAEAIFAVRPRLGRHPRFGTALAFLPGDIVVVHGPGSRSLTRIAHKTVLSIEHLQRAQVNHVAIRTSTAAYLFTLWPSTLVPREPFGARFILRRATSPARGRAVLREAISRTGIPSSSEVIS
jgi:hypothetical protein